MADSIQKRGVAQESIRESLKGETKELKARQAFLRMAQRMRSKNVKATSTFPATEDLQRQDRNR